jgi:hypothetical protein
MAKKCSKVDFLAVSGAIAPSNTAIRAALGNLNACHDAGAIRNNDFERLQAALIARFH